MSAACVCCTACFNSWLLHVCKNAYIDMAINGTRSFCGAANKAADLLANAGKEVVALAGATWLFTLTGLCAVSGVGAYITHIVITNIDAFSLPTSKWYIQDALV